jgi:hypothetical protein
MLLKGFKIDAESPAKVSDVAVCEVKFTAQAIEEIKKFGHLKNPVERPIKVRTKNTHIRASGTVQGGVVSRGWPSSSKFAL